MKKTNSQSNCINNYQFLISEREQGRFKEYMRRGLISTKLFLWLDVYQYHISNPSLSTWYVATYFGISQTYLREIYQFMKLV